MNIIVTGGAGFIGSAAVRQGILRGHRVVNVDKLTYAGDLSTVAEVKNNSDYRFVRADICNREAMSAVLQEFKPDLILHLAAETHVDRSIESPDDFVKTNVLGTTTLLDVTHTYWERLEGSKKSRFRFVSVSTDEVFGSLGEEGYFSEASPYDPSSPYSASKAAADQLSLAWFRTYGFPVIVTNCSNNFGPYQHPEKLIPTVVRSAVAGKSIPIYGTGENVRDWLFVDDHVAALYAVAQTATLGSRYCIGGNCEKTNQQIVKDICQILDEMHGRTQDSSYTNQIAMVEDRPGHDLRYAIDSSKIKSESGWQASTKYSDALQETVAWYLNHPDWLDKASHRIGLAKRHNR